MNFFEELAEKININEVKNKKEHFAELSNRYRNNLGDGNSSLKKLDEAKVYAFTRMPATSSAISSVIKNLVNKKMNSVLDVGAGGGAGLLAIAENFSKDMHITCIENCKPMTEILNVTKDILGLTNIDILEQDMCNLSLKQTYDLVMANYSLNELKQINIEKVLDKLYKATNNYILITESGTPAGYQIIMKCKQYLMNLGMKIVSPCKSTLCPVLNDYCHFIVRLQRPNLDRNIKSGTFSYEDEKFSYILLSKNEQCETYENVIIRRPVYKKGLILLTCCTKNDGVKNIKISKSQGEFYKKVKKFNIGDEF